MWPARPVPGHLPVPSLVVAVTGEGPGTPALDLPPGWTADGPRFKGSGSYLSADGTNPEAPWPGYGWPLGSECWYYVLRGRGLVLYVTGLTAESAARRAEEAAMADDPARFTGAVR